MRKQINDTQRSLRVQRIIASNTPVYQGCTEKSSVLGNHVPRKDDNCLGSVEEANSGMNFGLAEGRNWYKSSLGQNLQAKVVSYSNTVQIISFLSRDVTGSVEEGRRK